MPERSDFEVVRHCLSLMGGTGWMAREDAEAVLARLSERMEKLERVAEAAQLSVERFPGDVGFGGARTDLREVLAALAALAADAEEEK